MGACSCWAKELSRNFPKLHREIPVLESLSNNVTALQAVKIVTLLKRDSGTSDSEPAVRRGSTK